jgi:hypothetical protein
VLAAVYVQRFGKKLINAPTWNTERDALLRALDSVRHCRVCTVYNAYSYNVIALARQLLYLF